MPAHDLLFAAGMGRSGTTALRRVLVAHPGIALGMERYKRLWNGGSGQITADLFQKERFFDFSDGFTNLTPDAGESWRERYAELEAKWDRARYVGDKMTVIHFDQLHRLHPDAKFVFLVRDVDQVAYSWEQRARNPDDHAWPVQVDGRAAVRRWNNSLRRIGRAVRHHPEHAVVVEYARFFGDPAARSLRAVLDFLELEWEPQIGQAFAEAHAQYAGSVSGRPRPLSDELRAFIDDHAKRRRWETIHRLAV